MNRRRFMSVAHPRRGNTLAHQAGDRVSLKQTSKRAGVIMTPFFHCGEQRADELVQLVYVGHSAIAGRTGKKPARSPSIHRIGPVR